MSKNRPARHGRAPRLAVPAWPLRRKVALALAIPLLLAATLGGLRVANELEEAADASESAQQVTVLRPAIAYLAAAEQAMVAAQDTAEGSGADLEAAVQDLRSAARDLESTRDTADLTADQRYQVDVVLDLSRALREGSTDRLSPGTWVAQLRQLQSGVTQLITTIVNAQLEPEPRLELLSQTLGGRFSLAMQQALVATERTGETGDLELFAELGVEGAAIDRLAGELGASEPAVSALRTENAQRTRIVRTGGTDLGGAEAYEEYDQLIQTLMDGIDDELAAAASSARERALANAGITLGALLAAIIVALLISRLLLNPIRRVREGARAVAHERLPEAVAKIRAGEDPGRIVPIDVTTDEEVGQLARAVDDLHRQAVRLASGEAELRSQVSDMFVTLSRRNTSLINQQLGLIETLEKNEEDPARLESLFRLDHMAARMRRTADSLLVLADAPTRAGGHEDLTVTDALQAAIAGVQDYQRVRVGSASSACITDAAAADVIHLLTELVDNALAYSPPTTTVTLGSTTTPEGVTVEVADAGLGIPGDTLAALNETLRSGGDVTADTPRRMGLFVVSRLAQRYGITVSLQRNQDDGTTATVFLPNSVLRDTQQAGAPVSPPQLRADGERPSPATPEPATPDPIEATINASLGLPRREPGTSYASPDRTVEGTPLPVPVNLGPDLLGGDWGEIQRANGSDEPDADPPIFATLRSAWLTADGQEGAWLSSEIEAGWERAESVESSPTPAPLTESGLPKRDPGSRLVPGGVAKPKVAAALDPEAIRARLAAHAAGVSRGRKHVAHPPHETPEAGPE
jgi:signal transduction histidine kinase